MRLKFNQFFTMLCSLLLLGTSANAQVSALPFAQSTNTYIPITGGQVLGTTFSDEDSFVDPAVPGGGFTITGVGLPIGFSFNFNGRVYDRFAVQSNGWISLGQSALGVNAVNIPNSYTPISATSTAAAALQNRISAFSGDLQGNGFNSEIRYQTMGTAPSRVCIIQFKNWTDWPNAFSDLNFQFRLYEAGGVVEVHYGVCSASSASLTPQVGLRGDANTDFNNRSTTNNWSATTAGATNAATCTFNATSFPTNGLTFRWGAYNDDAGVSAINTPNSPLIPGFLQVQVNLQNFGINNLNTATVEWSANGIMQASGSYVGSLPSAGTAPINLGVYNFPPTPTFCKFWTSMPNGVADPNNTNDTIEVVLCAGLNGTYTVGSPTSDFLTIKDMIDALHSCGLTGPVTMDVQAGTHSGSMHFSTIPGLSATNTLTINGVAGAANCIITHNGVGINNNAVATFDGASHITIQNITLRNTGTTQAWGVLFMNNATHNTLLNNRIEMHWASNVVNVCGILFAASFTNSTAEGNNGNYNLIQGNEIIGGEMGIRMEGAAALRNKYNRIYNNLIHGADDYGMYFDDQDSLEIIGNKIYDLRSASNYGIYGTNLMNFDISKNEISARAYGLYLLNANTDALPQRRGKIVNNMVQFNSNYGIYANNARQIDLFHNTVEGTNLTDTETVCAYILTPAAIDVRNNIFVNGTGFLFRSSSSAPLTRMNNNLFYQRTPSTNFIGFGTAPSLILFNSFAQWQLNPFGHGVGDVYGDPIFHTATDLHADGDFADNAGDNTVGVLMDIDGESRPFTGSTQVDIGADEFDAKHYDAGVIAAINPTAPLQHGSFQPVSVRVKNYSIDTLDVVTVQWTYNGVLQPAILQQVFPPVPPQGTYDISLGSINLPLNQAACFEFWTYLPNSGQDQRTANDSLSVCFCPGLSSSYTVSTSVNVTPLSCSGGASGMIDLTVNSSNGPFSYQWSNGATTEDISGLNSGTYTVTITDANSCPYSESFAVSGPSLLDFNPIMVSNVSCNATNDGAVDITVVGGTAPYAFFWSTGATTEDINNLTSGTYAVTVIDVNGCSDSTTFAVNPASNVINISVDSIQDEETALGGAITVSATGGQAPLYLIWNTGETTATISGLVAGQYIVTVYDISGCTTTDTIVVNYAIPSNINDIEAVNNLRVFPNPTRDFVNIQLDLYKETEVRLDVYTVSGQLLQTFAPTNSLQQNYQVDLSQYAGGIYMARLIIGDKVLTTKIILQK